MEPDACVASIVQFLSSIDPASTLQLYDHNDVTVSAGEVAAQLSFGLSECCWKSG